MFLLFMVSHLVPTLSTSWLIGTFRVSKFQQADVVVNYNSLGQGWVFYPDPNLAKKPLPDQGKGKAGENAIPRPQT